MSETSGCWRCARCGVPTPEEEDLCEDCRLSGIRQEEVMTEREARWVEQETAHLEHLSERYETLRTSAPPSLRVCPCCWAEFRPGVKSCNDCRVELVDASVAVARLAKEIGDLGEKIARGREQPWEEIFQSDRLDLLLRVVRALDGEGIPSLVRGEGLPGDPLGRLLARPSARSYVQCLRVPAKAAEHARAIVEEETGKSAGGIDADRLADYLRSLVDTDAHTRVHCPFCFADFDRRTRTCGRCGYGPLLLKEELALILRQHGGEPGPT